MLKSERERSLLRRGKVVKKRRGITTEVIRSMSPVLELQSDLRREKECRT